MNITVTINAPELVSAIHALSKSLAGNQSFAAAAAPQASVPVQQPQQEAPPQNVVPLTQPSYQTEQFAQSAPLAPPVAPPVQGVPAIPPVAPGQAPGVVPTTTQTYSMDQLAVAATQLVDAGRQAEVIQMLQRFGGPPLTAVPKEHYGAVATELRALGAKI